MKVKVSFTLDVDPQAWATEYGVEVSEVREDVNTYIRNGALDQLSSLGLLKETD